MQCTSLFPSMCDCPAGDVAVVRLLLEAGADIDATDAYTPLQVGSEGMRARASFFRKGLNPAADCRGLTALHYAAVNDGLAVLELLMAAGADPSLATFQGKTHSASPCGTAFAPKALLACFGLARCSSLLPPVRLTCRSFLQRSLCEGLCGLEADAGCAGGV